MLRIRLQRTGRKRNPTFRVVVAEKTKSAKGKIVELVGHYLPAHTNPVFKVNEDRIVYWIGNGAIPTDTLARLLARKGMKNMEKYMDRYAHQKKRKAKEDSAIPSSDSVAQAKSEKLGDEKEVEKPKDDEEKEKGAEEKIKKDVEMPKDDEEKEKGAEEINEADDTEKKED